MQSSLDGSQRSQPQILYVRSKNFRSGFAPHRAGSVVAGCVSSECIGSFDCDGVDFVGVAALIALLLDGALLILKAKINMAPRIRATIENHSASCVFFFHGLSGGMFTSLSKYA